MRTYLAALLLAGLSTIAFAKDTKPHVFFVEPKNGATVPQEFKVVMGVKGMEVKPAGDQTPNSGHHHLLIDAKPIPKGEVVPSDAQHLHFGKGQTETLVKLAPGKHKLQLQFADFAHKSYGPAMRATITVHVK
ncbi:MAG: DUF4399 domain-containing protein [Burkholderiales bacterium]